MAVVEQYGNLFDSDQLALAQGVNVYGVMGAGIAVEFKRRYPEIYPPYVQACKDGSLQPGGFLPVLGHDGTWILNLASQDKPGRHAKLEWLETSLRDGAQFAKEQGLTGIALPKIGAGIGGLDWEDCLVIIKEIADDYPELDFELWYYEG